MFTKCPTISTANNVSHSSCQHTIYLLNCLHGKARIATVKKEIDIEFYVSMLYVRITELTQNSPHHTLNSTRC